MIVVVGIVAGAFIAAAFDGEGSTPPAVEVEWVAPTATPRAAGVQAAPRPTATPYIPSTALPPDASGFAFPLEGACLPQDDNLIPGALREYRHAVHEGLDFYDWDNCASVGLGTEVLAAKDGTVVRADGTYQELTPERLAELERRVAEDGGDDPEIEDAYRGRQVWVDHGDGIVTRYAHLSGIQEDIEVGKRVEQGEVIGYVGDSGTPESVTDPGTQVHLHLEIRVGDLYLGQGLAPEQVRRLYEQAFAP